MNGVQPRLFTTSAVSLPLPTGRVIAIVVGSNSAVDRPPGLFNPFRSLFEKVFAGTLSDHRGMVSWSRSCGCEPLFSIHRENRSSQLDRITFGWCYCPNGGLASSFENFH